MDANKVNGSYRLSTNGGGMAKDEFIRVGTTLYKIMEQSKLNGPMRNPISSMLRVAGCLSSRHCSLKGCRCMVVWEDKRTKGHRAGGGIF